MRQHAAPLAAGLGIATAAVLYLFGLPEDWMQAAADAIAVGALVTIGYGLLTGNARAVAAGCVLLGGILWIASQ